MHPHYPRWYIRSSQPVRAYVKFSHCSSCLHAYSFAIASPRFITHFRLFNSSLRSFKSINIKQPRYQYKSAFSYLFERLTNAQRYNYPVKLRNVKMRKDLVVILMNIRRDIKRLLSNVLLTK